MKKRVLLYVSVLLFSSAAIAQNAEEKKSWMLQFSTLLLNTPESRYGVETDGVSLYVSCWNNDTIFKYSLTGTFVEKFRVSGLTMSLGEGFRDLTYDGTYFYGSNASGNIFKMDFVNKVFIDTVICPSTLALRHLTRNPVNGDFWGGDWNTLYRISSAGAVLDTMDVASLGFTHISGCAYDTAGNDYLWIADQGGNGVTLARVSLNPFELEGGIYDATADLGPQITAAGLFLSSDLVPGSITLGGICQRVGDELFFGYHTGTVNADHDLSVLSSIAPASSCFPGNAETLAVRIKNNGLSEESNFQVLYKVNGSAAIPVVYTDTIHPQEEISLTLTSSLDLSTEGVYDFVVYTALATDADRSDDTLQFSAEHQVNLIPPIYEGFNSPTEFQGWTVLDANQDGFTWHYSPGTGMNNSGSFEYSFNSVNDTIKADDWLFTRCLGLAEGLTYFVNIAFKANSYNLPEKFRIRYGELPDTNYMDSTLLNLPNVTNTQYTDTLITMVSPLTGTLYFGIQCYSNANRWNLNIDEFIITALPGFPENSRQDILLYPNPASDQIFVRSQQRVESIKIFNMLGLCVRTESPGATAFALNVSGLASGYYLIQCQGGDQIFTKKIMIK